MADSFECITLTLQFPMPRKFLLLPDVIFETNLIPIFFSRNRLALGVRLLFGIIDIFWRFHISNAVCLALLHFSFKFAVVVLLLLLLQALVVAHPGLIWVFADANQQSFQLSRVADEGLSAKVPARYCPPYRVSSGAGCHVVDCLRISAMFAIWCPLMTEPCQGGSVQRRVPAHALVPDNLVSSVV